jgi:NAD(P)-dependent dehydrogenase (short-subunit alcohol dehydrogenase family)
VAGRVALVTGGTRGIGAAISKSLAGHGAIVAAGYSSNRERAEAFQRTLDPDRTAATVHRGNVGIPEDCQRVVQEVMERHGRLDILVNNAGVTVDRPVSAMTVDDSHQVLRVNLSSAFYPLQASARPHARSRLGSHHQHPRSSPRPATSVRPTTPPPSPASSASPSRSHAKRHSPWTRPGSSKTASASPSMP